jgi:hypothetical protein
LLTIWDLTYYVEKFVIEKNVRTKNIHRSKVFA